MFGCSCQMFIWYSNEVLHWLYKQCNDISPNILYFTHVYCNQMINTITYIVWWYKIFYQVEPVVWTSITTSRYRCDAVCSHNRQDLKTNNKGRNKINKFVQYSEGDYILHMMSRLFVAVRSIALLTLLTWQNSLAENISCNVAPFFYHHSVVIQHLVSDTLYQIGDFL